MDDGHYILPHELVLMIVLFMLPGWLLFGCLQYFLMRKKGSTRKRAWASVATLVLFSPIILIVFFFLSDFFSIPLPDYLGVIYIHFLRMEILPLAFILTGLTSFCVLKLFNLKKKTA